MHQTPPDITRHAPDTTRHHQTPPYMQQTPPDTTIHASDTTRHAPDTTRHAPDTIKHHHTCIRHQQTCSRDHQTPPDMHQVTNMWKHSKTNIHTPPRSISYSGFLDQHTSTFIETKEIVELFVKVSVVMRQEKNQKGSKRLVGYFYPISWEIAASWCLWPYPISTQNMRSFPT